jgi:LmbE family N-acetylglucosaminyl deacetylase
MRTAIILAAAVLVGLPPSSGRVAADTPEAEEAGPLDLLVIAPHPDDEAIGCGGVMLRAVKEGRRVGVVLVTGGGGYPAAAAAVAKKAEPQLAPEDFLRLAAVRRRHSVDALTGIGVRAQDLMSLGYPDSGLKAIYEARAQTPYRQPFTGKAETYGTVIRDYHTIAHGRPAPYLRSSVHADLVEIIKARRPKEIYVTDEADTHPDHRTAFRFVHDAAKAAAYSGRLLSFVVHGAPPAAPDRRVVLTPSERARKRALIERYQTHLSPVHDNLAETYAGPEEWFRLVRLEPIEP